MGYLFYKNKIKVTEENEGRILSNKKCFLNDLE